MRCVRCGLLAASARARQDQEPPTRARFASRPCLAIGGKLIPIPDIVRFIVIVRREDAAYGAAVELVEIEPDARRHVETAGARRQKIGGGFAAGARNDENVRPKIADGGKLTDAYEVALGRIKPGKKVVVIGGGRIGLTLAESLTDQGHEAIIVESSKRVGNDVAPTWKWRHTSWIKELKIPVMTSTRVTRVTASSATVVNAEGEEKELAADMVIYAAPQKPNQEVFQALQWMVDEVHMIGDAMAPRGMTSAIHDGYRLGCRI